MKSDRWRHITEIFHAAIAREPDSRDAFLTDACRQDPSLREEVERLLASHQEAGTFGETAVAGPAQRAGHKKTAEQLIACGRSER